MSYISDQLRSHAGWSQNNLLSAALAAMSSPAAAGAPASPLTAAVSTSLSPLTAAVSPAVSRSTNVFSAAVPSPLMSPGVSGKFLIVLASVYVCPVFSIL